MILISSSGGMVLFSVLLALMIVPADTAFAIGTVDKIQSGLITSDSMTSGDISDWTFGGSAAINDYYEDSDGLTIGIRAPQNGQWVGYYAYRYQPDAYLFHSTVTIHDDVVSDGVSNVGLYVEGSDFVPHVGCEAYADWSGHYWVVEQSSDAGETYNIIYITQPNEFPQTQDCTIITNGDNYLKVYIGGNLVFESDTMNLGMSAPLIAYFQDDTSSFSSMHYATYSDYYSTSDENIHVTDNPANAARVKIVDSSNNILADSPVVSGTATLDVGRYNFPLSGTINVYDSSNSVIASSSASIYGGDIYSVDVPLQTAPQPPTALTSSATSPSQINLSWNTPSNTGGSPITGYKIERSVDGGAFSVLVPNTGSTSTTYSNTGLAHSTQYSYRVSAINAIGTSSASNVSSATTFDVNPFPPTDLAATVISSSQIDLEWSTPSDDGGSPITDYKIERSTNGGSTWNIVVSNTGNADTAYSNTGLAPNTAYTYRVSAITLVGTSSPSNLAFGTTPQQPPKVITLAASGLVSFDPLNNETKTRQELEAEQGFWHYGGSAFSYFNPPAPTDVYKDSEGLHVGVKTPANGTYAGYYGVTQPTNATLFHAKITTPIRTISGDFFQNGLYVQTWDGRINYVTCVAITSTAGTSWHVVRTFGNTEQATQFEVLWSDLSSNQSLTKDCTIITNGNNYLKIYLDGIKVYQSNTIDLQMPGPFLYFVEPQNSHAEMLYGIYEDYYSTKDETVKLTNIPSGASRVDVLSQSGSVLATSPVSNSVSTLDVGMYHFPITANIKVYDSNDVVIASTSSSVEMFGGDIYFVN
jgi:hypothetical protein